MAAWAAAKSAQVPAAAAPTSNRQISTRALETGLAVPGLEAKARQVSGHNDSRAALALCLVRPSPQQGTDGEGRGECLHKKARVPPACDRVTDELS